MYEKSLVLIKPDGVKRHLMGRILQRFEEAGIKIHAMHFQLATRDLAEEHYAEHRGKDFFEGVIKYLTSGPVLAMVLGGHGIIERVRTMVGSTCPHEAAPGTIRGDFAHLDMGNWTLPNLIHASADEASAQREIDLWFDVSTIIDYEVCDGCFQGQKCT